MCLVDTPGIGSVFLGNTETTRAFVPHIDAALVVLGADPPISADELALVEEIGKQCRDLFFVLNKADKLADAEIKQAIEFTRRILSERLGKSDTPVYEVSATERLAGQGPARAWPELTASLGRLAHQSGSELVHAAEQRGLALLADRLRHYLDEERGALLRPVDESERRIQTLRVFVAEAERSLNDLGYLFNAEQDRLGRIFSDRKNQFLKRAIPEAQRELADAIRAVDKPRRGPALRDKAIDLTHEISQRWLDRWLAESQPIAESLYVEATQRFVDLANGFLEKLTNAGDPALGVLPRMVPRETGFRMRSRLYYTSLMTLASESPLQWLLDLVRSREQELRALDRQIGKYLGRLVYVNAHRVEADFNDRVLESRRSLQYEIKSTLTNIAASAESALNRANQRRAQGSQAVQAEVERINALSDRLEGLSLERKVAIS
jgi:hypothetical protein